MIDLEGIRDEENIRHRTSMAGRGGGIGGRIIPFLRRTRCSAALPIYTSISAKQDEEFV